MAQTPYQWRYGYELTQMSQVKSGTLYPLLIRLEEQGFLEAAWEEFQTGRPPRHIYRLTAMGRELAANELAAPRTGASLPMLGTTQ